MTKSNQNTGRIEEVSILASISQQKNTANTEACFMLDSIPLYVHYTRNVGYRIKVPSSEYVHLLRCKCP